MNTGFFDIPAFAFAAGAFAMTYLGGRIALHLGRGRSLLLGFAAGVVLGIALLDLLPTALGLGGALGPLAVPTALTAGFAIYLVLDQALSGAGGRGGLRTHLGPASLTVHSFLDGIGIALAFHVSAGIGLLVALAVLAHDFCDGANTVALSLVHSKPATAHRWLLGDAAAPLAGVVIGGLIRLPDAGLALFLAGFAGALLHIGACELIPRGRDTARPGGTVIATIAGIAFIYLVVRVAPG